jgi:DDE superfamily endonuclease
VILLALPAYSPELNPVERIWLYLKERYLSHRLLDDCEAIVDAACVAWNKLTAEAGRITTLCSYPWLKELVGPISTVKIWRERYQIAAIYCAASSANCSSASRA